MGKPKEKDQSEKSSRRPPPPPPARRNKYWGYIARIVFVVVVAICFSKRDVIKASLAKFSNQQAGGDNPEVRQADGDKPAVNPPLKPPEPDYYNPPFDPNNPPETIYSKSGVRMITKNELAAHGHSGPLKPIWLAMLGQVFDVDKGAEHYYGPDGGYNFFTGIDGTKAFVTGEFNEEGLIDDISELSPLQLGELDNWVKFYRSDYTYVGKLIGRYYNRNGSPTREWYAYQKKLGEKDLIKAEMRKMEEKFPPCNSYWDQATEGKVFCSTNSGGISRDWVGYPRRFFAPGTVDWRCACAHEDDLNDPKLKLYPDCDPKSSECKVIAEQIKALRKQRL